MAFRIGELVKVKIKGTVVFGEILDTNDTFSSILLTGNVIIEEILTKNLRLLF